MRSYFFHPFSFSLHFTPFSPSTSLTKQKSTYQFSTITISTLLLRCSHEFFQQIPPPPHWIFFWCIHFLTPLSSSSLWLCFRFRVVIRQNIGTSPLGLCYYDTAFNLLIFTPIKLPPFAYIYHSRLNGISGKFASNKYKVWGATQR